jgi:hypothetical protein
MYRSISNEWGTVIRINNSRVLAASSLVQLAMLPL